MYFYFLRIIRVVNALFNVFNSLLKFEKECRIPFNGSDKQIAVFSEAKKLFESMEVRKMDQEWAEHRCSFSHLLAYFLPRADTGGGHKCQKITFSQKNQLSSTKNSIETKSIFKKKLE